MDEIQAALLRVKLRHIDEITAERRAIAEAYLFGIKNPDIILPTIAEGASHVWHLFVVRTEKRDELQQYLAENGIGTQIHYPVPPHLAEAYTELGHKVRDFPITEDFAGAILSLPLYNGMTNTEVEYVADTIAASKTYLKKNFKRDEPLKFFLARYNHYLMHSMNKEFIKTLLEKYALNGFKALKKKDTKALYEKLNKEYKYNEYIRCYSLNNSFKKEDISPEFIEETLKSGA